MPICLYLHKTDSELFASFLVHPACFHSLIGCSPILLSSGIFRLEISQSKNHKFQKKDFVLGLDQNINPFSNSHNYSINNFMHTAKTHQPAPSDHNTTPTLQKLPKFSSNLPHTILIHPFNLKHSQPFPCTLPYFPQLTCTPLFHFTCIFTILLHTLSPAWKFGCSALPSTDINISQHLLPQSKPALLGEI